MKRSYAWAVAALAVMGSLPSAARAEYMFSLDLGSPIIDNRTHGSAAHFGAFTYEDFDHPDWVGLTAIEDLRTGLTITITKETDVNFSKLAAKLTNGRDDLVHFAFRLSDGRFFAHGNSDSAFLRQGPIPFTGRPDLVGEQLTAMKITFDDLQVTKGTFGGIRIGAKLTVTLETDASGPAAPAPVPGTLALAGLAGVTLGGYAWRRRRLARR